MILVLTLLTVFTSSICILGTIKLNKKLVRIPIKK